MISGDFSRAAATRTATGDTSGIERLFTALPKAELHVHLEGTIQPSTAVELAARHGVSLTVEEVAAHYTSGDFVQFLEAFKWVTSLLQAPADYAWAARRFAESLRRQNVLYAEVTLSVGVMLRRKQDPEAIFFALREAASQVPGVRLTWIFDAVRQWGVRAATEVARVAVQLNSPDIVAFGVGGDELALPAIELRPAYEYAASQGLHRLIHAGEIGGPESVREALEVLGAERIGHGIGAMRDERTMDLLAARAVPLELCLTSNLRTGALARQLGGDLAGYEQHPLASLFRHGVPVTLSSDDPAIFETTLSAEYAHASRTGLAASDLMQIAEASFRHAFLPAEDKKALLDEFHSRAAALGLV